MTPRRTAQLGLYAGCAVLVLSMSILAARAFSPDPADVKPPAVAAHNQSETQLVNLATTAGHLQTPHQ